MATLDIDIYIKKLLAQVQRFIESSKGKPKWHSNLPYKNQLFLVVD